MPPKKKDDKKKGTKEGDLGPEDKLKAEIARVENEKTDLSLELSFVRDKLQQKTATADNLELELLELGAKHDKSTRDYMDILEHKEVQLKGSEKRVNGLEQQVEQLQTELSRMEERMATLIAEADVHKAQLESTAGILGQQQQLEEAARRQDSVIARQEEEVGSLKGQIGGLQQQLTTSADKSLDLTLKASGTTELKILFGEAWLVALTRQRLLGEVPGARDGNTLCCFGPKLLVMYGGHPHIESGATSNAGPQRELNPLQLDTGAWGRPLGGKAADFVNCHSAVSVARTKMMAFGSYAMPSDPQRNFMLINQSCCRGQRGHDVLDGVAILHTDSMKWVTPVVRGAAAPCPRIRHAAACSRDKVFIFGGQGPDGVMLNDTWEWHMDTLHWTPVKDFLNGANPRYRRFASLTVYWMTKLHTETRQEWLMVCSGEPPSARVGASLCASEDGRRLWLFGGNAGGGSLNDLHFMDLETHTWTQVTVSGNSPTAREGHAACILSRFLLISTGLHTAASGSERRLADTRILDLGTLTWDCLDDGAWASGLMWKQTLGQYCVFHGNRLYILKPSKDDKLDELLTLDFTLPEDIERLKTEKRKGNMIYDTLDIMPDATCTSNSIEVAWRPPTKNAERIVKFKLMLATTTGVVKEVYQGLHTRFRSTALRPDIEYIFCVKATYDDGSYAWSESRAFQTRA